MQYFALGEIIGGSSYFFSTDHLGLSANVHAERASKTKRNWRQFDPLSHSGSIREITNSSALIQGQLSYDPFGRTQQIQGVVFSDFQFAGMYEHLPSHLNVTQARPYNPQLGAWISRDPVKEMATQLARFEPAIPDAVIPAYVVTAPESKPRSSSRSEYNRYVYVMNDPVELTDLSGLNVSDWDCCDQLCTFATKSALGWLICMMWCLDNGCKHNPNGDCGGKGTGNNGGGNPGGGGSGGGIPGVPPGW